MPTNTYVVAIDREHLTTSRKIGRYRDALAAFREAERDPSVLAASLEKWVDGTRRALMCKYTKHDRERK